MADETKDKEEVGELVDSITNHPGLQTVKSEEGETPATDPYAEGFYARHTPGGQSPSARPQPTGEEAAAPAEDAASSEPTTPGTPAQPAPSRSAAELEREIQTMKSRLQERNAENLALKAVNDHMEALANAIRPPSPAAPRRVPIAFDENNQPYASLDEIENQAADRIRQLVDQRVQESLRPITQANETYTRMKRDFSDFASEESRFSEWLNAHPDYRERISKDPDIGMESAYLRYRYDAGQAHEQQVTQNAAVAQNVVSSAQKHAAPAGGVATPNRRVTETDARNQRMQALLKYAQETGDYREYKKARMVEGLGESFLSTMDQTTWGR